RREKTTGRHFYAGRAGHSWAELRRGGGGSLQGDPGRTTGHGLAPEDQGGLPGRDRDGTPTPPLSLGGPDPCGHRPRGKSDTIAHADDTVCLHGLGVSFATVLGTCGGPYHICGLYCRCPLGGGGSRRGRLPALLSVDARGAAHIRAPKT